MWILSKAKKENPNVDRGGPDAVLGGGSLWKGRFPAKKEGVRTTIWARKEGAHRENPAEPKSVHPPAADPTHAAERCE